MKPDSIYSNVNNLKPGVIVADEKGIYLQLIEPTVSGWIAANFNTKEVQELELVKDMTDMRFVGELQGQTDEGINMIDWQNKKT